MVEEKKVPADGGGESGGTLTDDGGGWGDRLESFGGSGGGSGAGLEGSEVITAEHPGRYTIRGEQGRGAIGRVLLAVDGHIGREVALKELLPDRSFFAPSPGSSPGGVTRVAAARFLREARITGRLEHPGIVPVHEIGRRADGSMYYTMELVRGETLADKLKAARPGGIGARLQLLPHFLDLCQAMAYAHAKSVIHRDLKPANIMVGQFGQTIVLDWGLAKVRGSEEIRAGDLKPIVAPSEDASAGATVQGSPLGTPSYMSPEQAEGRVEAIDERSDVWGLGAILYELLTGRPPFVGATAWEVMGKVTGQALTPVAEVEPSAPGELAAIAERCLAKEPERRFAHAGMVAEAIEAVERRRELIAVRESARRHDWLIFSRPLGTMLLLAGVLGLVGVTASWLVRNVWVEYDNPLSRFLIWLPLVLGAGAMSFRAFMGRRALPGMFIVVLGTWGAVVAASMGVEVIDYLIGLPPYHLLGVHALLMGIALAATAMQTNRWLVIAAVPFFPAGIVIAMYPGAGREILGGLIFVVLGGAGLFLRLRPTAK